MTRRCRWSAGFDMHAADGRCWWVRVGRQKSVLTARLAILCGCETVYRGKDGREPRAYLVGSGRVYVYTDSVVIRP